VSIELKGGYFSCGTGIKPRVSHMVSNFLIPQKLRYKITGNNHNLVNHKSIKYRKIFLIALLKPISKCGGMTIAIMLT
jgi:hypothetical protein